MGYGKLCPSCKADPAKKDKCPTCESGYETTWNNGENPWSFLATDPRDPQKHEPFTERIEPRCKIEVGQGHDGYEDIIKGELLVGVELLKMRDIVRNKLLGDHKENDQGHFGNWILPLEPRLGRIRMNTKNGVVNCDPKQPYNKPRITAVIKAVPQVA